MVKRRGGGVSVCRNFDRAVEEWHQFHCDLNDLSQWLSEAERALADTRHPDGTLDLEKAGAQQEVRVPPLSAPGSSCVRPARLP